MLVRPNLKRTVPRVKAVDFNLRDRDNLPAPNNKLNPRNKESKDKEIRLLDKPNHRLNNKDPMVLTKEPMAPLKLDPLDKVPDPVLEAL